MPSKQHGIRNRFKHQYPDLLRILRLVRFEVQLALASAAAACSPKQRAARSRVAGRTDLKVQLGSGPNPVPGWINVDGSSNADIRADLRRGLPFSDASVACIFTEHFLDHLAYPDGIGNLLLECHRVLKPGGVMRAIVHDADLLLRAYVEKDVDFFRGIGAIGHDPAAPEPLIGAVNHLFRFNGFHQFIYDFEALDGAFRRAGFGHVYRSAFGRSAVPGLNLDLDFADRAPQSLYVEAVK